MSVDSSDQPGLAARRPWRLHRIRARTPQHSQPRKRMRAAPIVAAVVCVLTIAAALGAAAIAGRRAGPPSIRASEENPLAASIAPKASDARVERTAAPRGAIPAPGSSVSPAPSSAAAPALDPSLDYPGLGVRARPLSEAERREIGAGAPDDGWKIINAREGAPLRSGDVITGACGKADASSLREVMTSLIEESKMTQCLVVLRNGETIQVGPDQTGPSL